MLIFEKKVNFDYDQVPLTNVLHVLVCNMYGEFMPELPRVLNKCVFLDNC